MALYDRYAKDLSEALFNSIYDDLYARAENEQRAIWRAAQRNSPRRQPYYVGEAQDALNAFCKGKLSLGEAMDFLALTDRFAATREEPAA